MIRFILGEDRHVKFRIHSTDGEPFTIREGTYRLLYAGEEEAAGECHIIEDVTERFLDIKLQPLKRSKCYILEITLKIADEVVMDREQMEVI